MSLAGNHFAARYPAIALVKHYPWIGELPQDATLDLTGLGWDAIPRTKPGAVRSKPADNEHLAPFGMEHRFSTVERLKAGFARAWTFANSAMPAVVGTAGPRPLTTWDKFKMIDLTSLAWPDRRGYISGQVYSPLTWASMLSLGAPSDWQSQVAYEQPEDVMLSLMHPWAREDFIYMHDLVIGIRTNAPLRQTPSEYVPWRVSFSNNPNIDPFAMLGDRTRSYYGPPVCDF
jgi:hypothetical protein